MWGAQYRHVDCMVCGKGFMDDCGDTFCCSSCESQYEREHEPCGRCGEEVGEDNLTDNLCDNCIEEEEEE